MSNRPDTHPTPLGIYDKARKDAITGIEVIAIALSLLWLVGTAVFFLVMEPSGVFNGSGGAMQFVMVLLAIFMPVAMIWVAATAARASKVMREESQRLQTAIDAIRQAYVAQNQGRNTTSEPSVAKKLDEIAAAQRKTESALATFSSTRQATTVRPVPPPAETPIDDNDQVALPLGTSSQDMQPPYALSARAGGAFGGIAISEGQRLECAADDLAFATRFGLSGFSAVLADATRHVARLVESPVIWRDDRAQRGRLGGELGQS